MARQQIPHQIYKDNNGVEHVRVREGGGIEVCFPSCDACSGTSAYVLSNAECPKEPPDRSKESRSSPPVPFDANR